MQASRIRILIVDDHLMVRQGIAQLLAHSDDIEIVGEADSGEAALVLCENLAPDIVLMDLRMAGMGGLAATEAIRLRHPGIRVIGLSTFSEEHMVSTMIASGAHGHLSKSVTREQLIDAIRSVHDGFGPVNSEASATSSAATAGSSKVLTARQRRVLALLVKGFTNAEIASFLEITVSTANYHVGAIIAKLGVSNRTEAVATAVREQLVDEFDV